VRDALFGAETAPPRVRTDGARSLRAHSDQFAEAEVLEPVPGVHVAIGFGLANSILLRGEGGVVIVDAMESDEAARPVRAAFDAITTDPVKALVYTHNHADHIFGSRTLAAGAEPDVYAHATTRDHILKIVSVIRPAIYRRSMRQFGTCLGEGDHINSGIGPRLRVGPNTAPGLLWPTITVEDRMEIEVAGLRLELGHVPGETPDHLYVWMPDRGVLIPGDDYYHTFPNLYAIRGTAYRDVTQWVASIDRMLALAPEVLVPCHTRPVHGRKEIERCLRNYRDAIQFVHDQTVRGINEGLSPDAIVERVKLPKSLADEPYLQEHYGRVPWAVRSIYAGYLGWFDGDAANLHRLPPKGRAERMAKMVGGADALLEHARRAADADDPQWALELLQEVLALDPDHGAASQLRARCLRVLGESEISANGRNYYLTQALEAAGAIDTPRANRKRSGKNLLGDIPLEAIFASMSVALDAEAAEGVDAILGFSFTDLGADWTLHVRNGVAVAHPARPDAPVARLTTESRLFKEMLTGVRNPAVALASSAVKVEGSLLQLGKTLALFEAV
jgi:alkyl sulfatase BDS1-like metallo-beta-lactamase superfamily hydrolase